MKTIKGNGQNWKHKADISCQARSNRGPGKAERLRHSSKVEAQGCLESRVRENTLEDIPRRRLLSGQKLFAILSFNT